MLAEAIDKILSLATPALIKEYALTYSDKKLDLVMPPIPNGFTCSTLAGLADLVEATKTTGEEFLIQIASPVSVGVKTKAADHWGRYENRVIAKADPPDHWFGKFMAAEEMVIWLRSRFAPSPDLAYVLNMAGNVAAGAEVRAKDDGVTQDVTMRRGVSLKGVEALRPIVKLAPFRTFPDIEPSLSDLLFRARANGDQPPVLALFEADGGAWKLDASCAIQEWMAEHLPDFACVR